MRNGAPSSLAFGFLFLLRIPIADAARFTEFPKFLPVMSDTCHFNANVILSTFPVNAKSP